MGVAPGPKALAALLAGGLLAGLAQAVPSCEARFADFLRAYANDERVQRTATRFPLPVQRLDAEAQPEPRTTVRRVAASEAKFPLMPPDAARLRDGLQVRIARETRQEAEVVVFKPDTDHQVVYVFARGPCWRLQAIRDESL